jgi:hypothetical protein
MRANRAGERKNALGGPRKPLIRLDSDKEIKVNAFDSLWPGLAGFASIWPNLDSAWIFLGCYTLHIGATDLILRRPLPKAKGLPEPAEGMIQRALRRCGLGHT